MQTPKFICCITHMLLNSRYIRMSACPGEELLIPTHCKHCEYWKENQYIFEDDESDDEEEETEE